MIRNLLLVGTGGFLGAGARYLVGYLLTVPAGAPRFPLNTLVVNVTGCLAIGLLAGTGERSEWLTAPVRLFLLTGELGGYTTFSAFGHETFILGRDDTLLRAGLNVAAHVVLGLLAVFLGHRIGSALAA